MAQMVFQQEKENKLVSFTEQKEFNIKVECSERDLSLSQSEVQKLKQKGMSTQDILKYKQAKLNMHDEIYKDVPFKRECEWTVLDNISGDYFDHMMDTQQEAYIGKYTKISDMARKDNIQRIKKDKSDFNNWKHSIMQIRQQKQSNSTKQPLDTLPKKKESFDQRSSIEIQIAEQINIKNQAIKQQKMKEENKKASSNKGFANTIVLSFIAVLVMSALLMIIFMILRK